jgi:serine kinase of HPr protein (carbohydrate metabolism regulator)
MSLLHASCVEFEGIGILLRGPSGAGKSDLALRLIDSGATLIADDQVLLEVRARRLIARPPDTLAGLIEVRGVGVVEVPYRRQASVELVVDLVARKQIERLPTESRVNINGVTVTMLRLTPFDASAVAKLRLAARLATGQARFADTTIGASRLKQRSS